MERASLKPCSLLVPFPKRFWRIFTWSTLTCTARSARPLRRRKSDTTFFGTALGAACLVVFAQPNVFPETLRDEAVSYREAGSERQQHGDWEGAKTAYQKAEALDPSYAVARNDLGVIYEHERNFEQAQAAYEQAVQIDPNYLAAHTNLAILYERLGQKEKAIYHWLKRYELGALNDPWTARAEERLGALGALTPTSSLNLLTRKLLRALQDPDWHVRYAAVWAIGQMKEHDEQTTTGLVSALQDEQPDVRRAAAQVLDQWRWKPRTPMEQSSYDAARHQAIEQGAGKPPQTSRAASQTVGQATATSPSTGPSVADRRHAIVQKELNAHQQSLDEFRAVTKPDAF